MPERDEGRRPYALAEFGTLSQEELLQREQADSALAYETGSAILDIYPLITQAQSGQINAELMTAINPRANSLVAGLDAYHQRFPVIAYRNDPLLYEIGLFKEQGSPNRYLPRFLTFFDNVLAHFNLPDLTPDDVASMQEMDKTERLQLVGAPPGLEGMRFLPGFRQLDWRKEVSDETIGIEYIPGSSVDIMRFRKPWGRSFFLASVDGNCGLDEILKKNRALGITIPIGKVEIVKNRAQSSPFLIFDRDGTIIQDHRNAPNFSTECDELFAFVKNEKLLASLWTRDSLNNARYTADRFFREKGILFEPVLAFENWPLIHCGQSMYRRGPVEFYPYSKGELRAEIAAFPEEARPALITYARENFGLYGDDQAVLDGLADRLDAYFQAHPGWKAGDDKYEQTLSGEEQDRQYIARSQLLEAKVPLFAAFSTNMFSYERRLLIENGVLINDADESLGSATYFGYNVVFTEPPRVGNVKSALALACGLPIPDLAPVVSANTPASEIF